jgi:hypothetical protein
MSTTLEDYFSAEDDDYIRFDINTKTIDKKDEDTYLITLTFRELLVYSDNWCYNRTISTEKVDEIYESLCSNYNIPFILHAVYDSHHNNSLAKLLILDGQHRKEAIRKYINQNDVNMDCPHKVWICVYKINHSETNNTNTVIDIFKKINNNRIFDEKELPNTFIIDLIKSICNIPAFRKNNVIKTNDTNLTAHAPFIHKKELNTLFNQHQDVLKSSKLTIVELTNNIQIINHKISLIKFEDLYTVANRKLESNRYQKAVAKNFFLNLKNSKIPIEVWITYICKPDVLPI